MSIHTSAPYAIPPQPRGQFFSSAVGWVVLLSMLTGCAGTDLISRDANREAYGAYLHGAMPKRTLQVSPIPEF